jgi:hypothetical protein
MDTYACSCGGFPRTEQQVLERVDEAGLVFLARVEEKSVRTWAMGSEVKTEALAKVTMIEGFKGGLPGLELIIDTDRSSCAADLNVRDTYLIFAYGPMPGGLYQTNMCHAFLYETVAKALPEYYEQLKEGLALILDVLRKMP